MMAIQERSDQRPVEAGRGLVGSKVPLQSSLNTYTPSLLWLMAFIHLVGLWRFPECHIWSTENLTVPQLTLSTITDQFCKSRKCHVQFSILTFCSYLEDGMNRSVYCSGVESLLKRAWICRRVCVAGEPGSQADADRRKHQKLRSSSCDCGLPESSLHCKMSCRGCLSAALGTF